jgi:hypothetical protein
MCLKNEVAEMMQRATIARRKDMAGQKALKP